MAESAALLVDAIFPCQPVRQWVLSFPYPLRFLFASRPAVMGRVLGIVYRVIATHLIRKAGFTTKTAHTGAVTLIQCFGGSLNLNVHFHMLFLDGVYVEGRHGSLKRFQWVKAPTSDELTRLTHTIARRVGRFLQRQGLLESDAENCYLTGDAADDDSMAHLQGHSITYRIAVGPHQGRKVFTLQTLPACDPDDPDTVGKTAGFSSACRGGGQSPGTGQAGTAVPLYYKAGRIRETPVTDRPRQGALRAEDTVSRWHHPCDLRSPGLHRPPRRPGAQTPESISPDATVCSHPTAHTAHR